MDMNYAAAAPEVFLGLAICVVLLVDVFLCYRFNYNEY